MGFNEPMTAARRKSRRTKSSASGNRSRRPDVPTDAVFTIDELVIYLKLPKSTVYKLAQEGKIPGQKVGRHWRFHKTAIDHWLSGRQTSKGEEDGST